MPRTLSKKGSILLAKGIDPSLPGEYIEDQAVTDAVNIDLESGIISKRKGLSLLGDQTAGSDTEVMAGRIFRREGTNTNVRVCLDNIEKYNSGTSSWDVISNTILTGTTDDLVSIATPTLSGKRILCVANGVDNIRKWTATGNDADLGGTPPVAKFIQEYKTYLVAANIKGGVDVEQRLMWSDTADPENWSTGNSGSLDLIEDGNDITGLDLFGDYLCVHKSNSIYLGQLVNTTEIFRFVRKATGVGTVANNSIVNLPTNEQVFVALDGIRSFNGISAPLIKAPINDEIRRTINKAQAHKSWGVLFKERDEVWLGIPTGSETYPQTVFKYNYKKGNVYKNVISNATAAWLGTADATITWDQATGTWDEQTERWNASSVISGADVINIGTSDGYVLNTDVQSFDDNSSAIDGYITTRVFQGGQEDINRWSELQLWAKGSGTLNCDYSTDNGQTWTSISNSPITLTVDYPTFDSPIMLYFDVVSSQIMFRFRNNTATDTFSIKQFTVGYRAIGNRR